MSLREPLQAVLSALLARSEKSRAVTLDEVGEALGTQPVSTDEIDALIGALEAAGRTVDSPHGGDGEESLRIVIAAAREMRAELGRNPSPHEISLRAAISIDRVMHALHLAKVIAR